MAWELGGGRAEPRRRPLTQAASSAAKLLEAAAAVALDKGLPLPDDGYIWGGEG